MLDVVKDLRNSRAVVVDVSAPPDLINALMNCFDPTMDTCLVLAATQVPFLTHPPQPSVL